MNPISARLLNQQLICPQFSTPHEVVSWMGAMQAQEYRMMRWAVGMRTKKPSAKAFEKAYNEGGIIRTHLFRSTWQLVAGEDLGWMMDLCRDSAIRAMNGWTHSNGVDIPEKERDAVQLVFADFLAQKPSALKQELEAALKDKGMEMDDYRLIFHIRFAEYSGLLCSGDLHPQKPTYALTADKLPKAKPITKEEALAKLAQIYFRSHGPATLEDFVWWTGLNTGDCRKGMVAIKNELTEGRWKGLTFYLHQESRTRGFRSGCVQLLPPYDEYLIGYKSRHVALHPDHRHLAHDQKGIFWPVILLGGEVVGNWSAAGGKVQTEVFHPEVSLDVEALGKEIARYLKFNSK